jgi:cytochrome P450
MKSIPKRRLIPLLTDLLEYKQAADNTIEYTRKKVEKYGDVCEVSFTGIKNYFIHDPEVIKEILTTQGPKMKRTFFFRAFSKFLGQGLFTSDGELHKQQRKLIKSAFYPQRIEGYANIMVACAEEELNHWKDGEMIDINQAMTRITLKIITKTMFSSGIDDDVITEVGKNLQSVFALINKILANPVYTYCLIHEIKLPIVRKFFKLKSELDTVVNGIIKSYRSSNDETRLDLLSLLMETKDEETGSGMSDEQIRDEVMTFFLAGHETTTLALTWTLYLLGKNPDSANKFYEEIQQKINKRLLQVCKLPQK